MKVLNTLKNLFKKGTEGKANGDSHFLAIAVALILVVVVGLLFKAQLVALFNSVFSSVGSKIPALF